MTRKQQAEALRGQLASADRSGAGRPFPKELRRAVVEHAAEIVRDGGSIEEAARELGVSAMSITRWTDRHSAGLTPTALRRVEVHAEPVGDPTGPIVVLSPSGMRIEGLSVSALVELLRAVG